MMITSKKRFHGTHITEGAHTRGSRSTKTHACACVHKRRPENARNHNFGRFRSAPFLPTVLSLRVVGQITGFRCARARGTLFGGANSKRRRQRKPVRKDTECRKEGERRNKTERERSREKRSVGSIPRERLCNTWRHSPVAFCAPLDRASQLGKSRTRNRTPLPRDKSKAETIMILDYQQI